MTRCWTSTAARRHGGRGGGVAPHKCPAAPYEAALLVYALLRRRGVRERAAVQIFVPEGAPLPVAGPLVGEQVQALLRDRDIEYRPQHALGSVDASERTLTFEGGEWERYDLLLTVPPHAPPAALADTPLVNEAGWVTVDQHTLDTSVPDVFAIGDATAIPLASGMRLPKAGVFAEGEAKAVARTIAHRITGRGSCFIEVGGGAAGYAAGDFYATDAGAVSLRGAAPWWGWYKSWVER